MSGFERFTVVLFEITRFWNKIATNVMKKEGLKGVQAFYIITIASHEEGALTATRLRELCQRDKAEISRSLLKLEEEGILIRKASEEKTYNARLYLTEKGKELAERLDAIAREAVEYAGKDLSEAEKENMYKSLESIASNLREQYDEEVQA